MLVVPHQEKRGKALVAMRSQSFEFVLEAKFFFFQSCDAHFVPRRMRHLCFDKLLYFLVFIRDFSQV